MSGRHQSEMITYQKFTPLAGKAMKEGTSMKSSYRFVKRQIVRWPSPNSFIDSLIPS